MKPARNLLNMLVREEKKMAWNFTLASVFQGCGVRQPSSIKASLSVALRASWEKHESSEE